MVVRVFFAALWRRRWFARATRHVVGARAGRGLRPVLTAFRPDLVVSTCPMGTAGLVCTTPGSLTATVRAPLADPTTLRGMESRAREHTRSSPTLARQPRYLHQVAD